MTLVIALGTGDGIVIGIDTRYTYESKVTNGEGQIEVHRTYLDGGHKILISKSHTNYGIAYVGQIYQGEEFLTPEVLLAEFDNEVEPESMSLEDFGIKFVNYCRKRISSNNELSEVVNDTAFWIFGLDISDFSPKLFRITLKSPSICELLISKPMANGFKWEGSGSFMMARLIFGLDVRFEKELANTPGVAEEELRKVKANIGSKFELPVDPRGLSINAASDFIESLIQTTHFLEKYSKGLQGVGKDSDILSVSKRNGTQFIRGRFS